MSTTPEPASVAAAKERVIEAARDVLRTHNNKISPISCACDLCTSVRALEATEVVAETVRQEQQAAPAAPRYFPGATYELANCARRYPVMEAGKGELCSSSSEEKCAKLCALLNAPSPAPIPALRAAAEQLDTKRLAHLVRALWHRVEDHSSYANEEQEVRGVVAELRAMLIDAKLLRGGVQGERSGSEWAPDFYAGRP